MIAWKQMSFYWTSCHRRLHLPDALSPHTLHATKVFVPVDELDELESAADDVVVVFEDDVGENGWPSASKDKNILVKNKSTINVIQISLEFFDLFASV